MFEPQKLIVLAFGIILLAPIGFVFWRITAYPARPIAERQAELQRRVNEEAALERERRLSSQANTPDEGPMVVTSVVRATEEVSISDRAPAWLSFYPRRWVGIAGLMSIAAILVCLIVSLFVSNSVEASAEVLSAPDFPAKTNQ